MVEEWFGMVLVHSAYHIDLIHIETRVREREERERELTQPDGGLIRRRIEAIGSGDEMVEATEVDLHLSKRRWRWLWCSCTRMEP